LLEAPEAIGEWQRFSSDRDEPGDRLAAIRDRPFATASNVVKELT
jgi:hypothetical protein